jgi:hypothetical protein
MGLHVICLRRYAEDQTDAVLGPYATYEEALEAARAIDDRTPPAPANLPWAGHLGGDSPAVYLDILPLAAPADWATTLAAVLED